ncbi:MAG: hypothetical protein CM1200mP13_13790 [Candidatus Pelagibacterales bacterium]|nr:MAG: hypothetical protein CM1200mP13_13790 [Pelagibacterales bacterium]
MGEGEYLLASDASPIIEHTRNVIYLDDDEFLKIHNSGYENFKK